MQAVAEASSIHETSGELVYDEDLAVLYDVVDVFLHEEVRTESLMYVVVELHVVRIREVVDLEVGLAELDSFVCQRHLIVLLFNLVVRSLIEGLYEGVGIPVHHAGVNASSGNDERCSGFIDEDRVDLVDDGIVELSLCELLLVRDHVVAQVVETELIVGAVCDVGHVLVVSRLTLDCMYYASHLKAEE